jgi:hypothetical protein
MIDVNAYGCSFTQILIMVEEIFKPFNFKNYGKESSNNFQIFNKFIETANNDSTCIVQWSSLTRPFDENFSLLETSENPLYDLLEQWYELVEETQKVAKERNIDLIQFIGWAIWKDDELNEYHRNKLNSLDIMWFESSPQWDLIASNCFQFQDPNQWSSHENEQGLSYWGELNWGGMSEWIRENVEVENRYMRLEPKYWADNGGREYDPHPSAYAIREFYQKVIFPLIIPKSVI